MEPLRAAPVPVPAPAGPARPAPAAPLLAAPGPVSWPAAEVAALVAAGEVDAQEVVAAYLAHLAVVEPAVHALVHVDAEGALRQARRVDRRRRRGDALGPLAGVPVVVKDNIDVRRQTTSTGSRAHAGVLALRDAPVVARVREAGGIVLARANMDELAMGASTQTSAFGATRNPWDPRRSPGGSSGGSAAAVAAGLAAVSIGTDTGGSIREPAAQCGVVGMAPSPRVVPTRGVVPFAPQLDRVGPLARTVTDAACLLGVLTGRRAPLVAGDRGPARPRVGLVHELRGRGNQPGVLARLTVVEMVLRALGAEVVPVSIPDAAAALGAYTAITSAACVPLLEPYVRTGQAGAEVERRWALGRALLTDRPAELADAHDLQRRLTAQAAQALTRCDVLVSPTMPTTAPLLRERTDDAHDVTVGELADPMHAPYTDCWSVVANLAGLPAVSLPAGCSPDDGMPVGVQLAGRAGSDAALLALAAVLEARVTG